MYLDEQGLDVPDEFTYRQPPGTMPQQVTEEDPLAGIPPDLIARAGGIQANDLENIAKYGKEPFIALLNQRAASTGGGSQAAPGQPSTFSFAGGSAPQSIQPYQPFSFDASKVGSSDAFKFRLDKAMQAIERSGAAKGTLLTPQTLKALQGEASGLASEEVGNEYGRQAGVYDRNFGTHQFNETNRYNSQRTNRTDDWGFMNADRQFNRGVLESDRGFNRGTLESDRGFDYTKQRDLADDTWRFIDYGYRAA
jgi:hypothetical protein